MASTREKYTSKGQRYYEIRVSRGRGKARMTTRWYVPDGWSQRAINRELIKISAEFERRCTTGEIVSRDEQKKSDLLKRQEAAKILTLKQYAEQVFMPAKTITLAENTRESYQSNLNTWILPRLGQIKLPEIKAADISALLLDMQAQGKALSTVLTNYTILNQLFKMAYIADDIDRNPMDRVQRPHARKGEMRNEQPKAYTAEELHQILNALNNEPLKWQALIRLIADTGIRRGECCGLRWKYCDFKKNTITIKGNLCYTKAKGVYLDTPKADQSRVIDVDPDVMQLLRLLQVEQAESCISPFVFSQEGSSEPMNPQSPTRFFHTFGKKYGIPDFHPHKLRHTFASVAIAAGADIASVSGKLGHSDMALTLRWYTHTNAEGMKRAGELFREAVNAAATG